MTSPFGLAQDASGPVNLDTTVDAPKLGLYTAITPHARGGLGEVFRATDPALHRTVAIKYLQDRHAENPESRQRFLLEAEVTARLEHPGIVPVYGLVAGGARPAYAMRFVEGQTFAEEIASYYGGPSAPIAFRRLLQAFIQVCQTVAYAHSRGVIHRDIKPANVMLGKFGEALVLDWGLAKVVGRPEEIRATGAGETLIPAAAGSGSGETSMGSAVGTPAYMSPEQAAGRWDIVAQQSDVYGLGALLYTILTARPPLEKGNWPELQQKIQRGDFPNPRQVNGDAPRPLEAVCLKAMALDPADRYTSVEALAEDVEHWLADEPLIGYREPLTTRARRLIRRHRTLFGAATVLLVAATVGALIGAFLLQRAQVETDKQRQSAVAAQRKAEAINRFLIDDLLKQADPVNNPVGEQLTVRELLDAAANRLEHQTNLDEQPEVEAEIRSVIGHAYEYLDAYDKALPQYERAWEARSRLSGLNDPITLALRNRVICCVVNIGKLPQAEAMARESLEICSIVLGESHAETAEAVNNLATIRTDQTEFDEAITLRRRASQIAHASGGPTAYKTLEYDNNLAATFVMAGRPAEAVPLFQSVAERRRNRDLRDPELAAAVSNLGGALIALGRFKEAQTVLEEAIPLQTKARGAKSPGTLAARNLFCFALEGQEIWAQAETGYREVLADRQELEIDKAKSSVGIRRTQAFLARLYAKQQRWGEAAPYLAKLMQSRNPEPHRIAEQLETNLAAALEGTSDTASAEPLLRECRDAIDGPLWRGDWLLAEVGSRHGDCLRRQERFSEAEPILISTANDIQKAVGVPPWGVVEARKRLVALYDARNEPAEAAKWR